MSKTFHNQRSCTVLFTSKLCVLEKWIFSRILNSVVKMVNLIGSQVSGSGLPVLFSLWTVIRATWLHQAPASNQLIRLGFKRKWPAQLNVHLYHVCCHYVLPWNNSFSCQVEMIPSDLVISCNVIITPVDLVMSCFVNIVPLDFYASDFVDVMPCAHLPAFGSSAGFKEGALSRSQFLVHCVFTCLPPLPTIVYMYLLTAWILLPVHVWFASSRSQRHARE